MELNSMMNVLGIGAIALALLGAALYFGKKWMNETAQQGRGLTAPKPMSYITRTEEEDLTGHLRKVARKFRGKDFGSGEGPTGPSTVGSIGSFEWLKPEGAVLESIRLPRLEDHDNGTKEIIAIGRAKPGDPEMDELNEVANIRQIITPARKLPGKISITVSRTAASIMLKDDDEYWLVRSKKANCKLYTSDGKPFEQLPLQKLYGKSFCIGDAIVRIQAPVVQKPGSAPHTGGTKVYPGGAAVPEPVKKVTFDDFF